MRLTVVAKLLSTVYGMHIFHRTDFGSKVLGEW